MLLTSECSSCIWKTLVSLTFSCAWPHYQEIVKFFSRTFSSGYCGVPPKPTLWVQWHILPMLARSEQSSQLSASLRTGFGLRKLLWPRSCPLPRSSPHLVTGLSRDIKTLFLCFNTRQFWRVIPASELPMGLS